MREILLFEIPVYAYSENAFDAKWRAKNEKLINQMIQSGENEESAKRIAAKLSFPYRLWRYNQIVGFIAISVTKNDVLFKVSCTCDKRFYIDSKTKHYIQDLSAGGLHFNINRKTDTEIKKDIRYYLEMIAEDHLKRFFIDYTAFNPVFEKISIRDIIDEIT